MADPSRSITSNRGQWWGRRSRNASLSRGMFFAIKLFSRVHRSIIAINPRSGDILLKIRNNLWKGLRKLSFVTNLNNLNNWRDQFVPDKNSLWMMSTTAQTSTQGCCRRVGYIRKDSTNEGKGTCPSPMTQRTRAVAKGSWVARVQIDGSTENARWWRCCDRVFVCVRVQLLFPLRDRQVAVVARGVG